MDLSYTFPHFGEIDATVTVSPDKVHAVTEAIRKVAGDLAAHGVTQDEFERAKAPAVTALHQSMRDNGYWMENVLSSLQEHPRRLEWSRTRVADVESIQREELNSLARQYLDPVRASVFVSSPAVSRGAVVSTGKHSSELRESGE